MSHFDLEYAAAHHFDQTQAEVLSALRKERKGFWVQLAGQGIFGFSVTGQGEEIEQFLLDIITSVEDELMKLHAVMPEEE